MKRVHSTGGKRMVELGKHPCQLWLTEAERETLKLMAAEVWRPVTEYIMAQIRPLIKEYREAHPPEKPARKKRTA